ncbi:hypothetical protein, partial [Bacteroides sp. 51]|uniref:hypothetical protein n=1 Tax=Bacteroides sp. 51 TaxID=2302938 RepID=UPI001940257F
NTFESSFPVIAINISYRKFPFRRGCRTVNHNIHRESRYCWGGSVQRKKVAVAQELSSFLRRSTPKGGGGG